MVSDSRRSRDQRSSASPLGAAALCLIAAFLAGTAIAAGAAYVGRPLDWESIVWLIGALAALGAWWRRLPVWWVPLLFLFVPALFWAQRLELHPLIYLAAFLATWLVLGFRPRERVPLFPSSREVWPALAELLPRGGHFVDLGCGAGGGLRRLAQDRPDATIVGVEASPLLWLLCRWRLRGTRAQAWRGDLWAQDLARFDVVYVFLSPAPMARLWRKAQREMRPGSLLISNGFPVAGVEPSRILELDDGRRTRLYLWEM